MTFVPPPRHRPAAPEPPEDPALHAALRDLPERPAPATLIPAVMAMVQARAALQARSWWRRPVTYWPVAARWAFALTAVTLLGGLLVGLQLLGPELQSTAAWETLAGMGDKFAAAWDAGRTVVNALGVALGSILTPTRLAILGAIIAAQVLVFGAGSAAMRALLQPRRVNRY